MTAVMLFWPLKSVAVTRARPPLDGSLRRCTETTREVPGEMREGATMQYNLGNKLSVAVRAHFPSGPAVC